MGDGPNTRIAESLISEISGNIASFLTPSCTDALDMCAILLNLEPGDEVIVPGFTFTSTATAFAQQRATIVFADVDPHTLNIDASLIEGLITTKTKAIVVVHYAGVACDMDAIVTLANKYRLTLIEDNAHGFGGMHGNKKLGTIGDMSTLSFHVTKNIQCGEGGAFLTRHRHLAARAHIIREKGTNRRAFLDGAVDKYTWVDQGSSFLSPDYVAAFLIAQLELYEEIHKKREHVWNRYSLELSQWANHKGFTLPKIPDYATHPFHLFWLTVSSMQERKDLLKYLNNLEIGATFHYQSLAKSPAGIRFGRSMGTPIADKAADTLIRLPLYADLNDSEIDRVISALIQWGS